MQNCCRDAQPGSWLCNLMSHYYLTAWQGVCKHWIGCRVERLSFFSMGNVAVQLLHWNLLSWHFVHCSTRHTRTVWLMQLSGCLRSRHLLPRWISRSIWQAIVKLMSSSTMGLWHGHMATRGYYPECRLHNWAVSCATGHSPKCRSQIRLARYTAGGRLHNQLHSRLTLHMCGTLLLTHFDSGIGKYSDPQNLLCHHTVMYV